MRASTSMRCAEKNCPEDLNEQENSMSSDRQMPAIGSSAELLARADSLLSTDFCPAVNKYVYWLKKPVWVLLLAIAGSIACGLVLNPLVFLLTAILLIVAAIGTGLPWVAIRGIRCNIIFDVPRTRVGQPALVRLVVTNRWPLPVWGLSLIKGFSSDQTTEGDEGVALARVPALGTAEFSWPFTPNRRGRYPNRTAVVETSFPFGLFRASREATIDGLLIAWPPTVRLDGMPDAFESQHTEEQFCDRRAGDFGDIVGTRTFRPGDSLRRVHWAQTARQQTLIVTERQAPAMTSVCVVVDLVHSPHSLETSDEAVELCVETAASICESLHRQHARIELVIGDNTVVAGDKLAGFRRMMDALSLAEPVSGPAASPSSSRRGFEICVTTHPPAASGRNLVVVGRKAAHAWLQIADRTALNTLPAEWRRACHVR